MDRWSWQNDRTDDGLEEQTIEKIGNPMRRTIYIPSNGRIKVKEEEERENLVLRHCTALFIYCGDMFYK